MYNFDKDAGDQPHEAIADVLASFNQATEYAESWPPMIADHFKRAVTAVPTKEQIEQSKFENKAPLNVKELGAPKVNMEVWNMLPKRAQAVDASYQHIQAYTSRSLIIQGRLICELNNHSSQIPSGVRY